MAEADFDIAQLSEEQQLALQQFTAVTNQELKDAVPLLQKCEWNIQIAIARFFDGEPPPVEEPANVPPPQTSRTHDTIANGFGRSQRPSSSSSSTGSHRQHHDPAPPIPSNHGLIRTPPLLFSLILAPANFLYRLIARFFNLFAYLFPFLPRLVARLTGGVSRPTGTATAGSNTSAPTTGRRPLGPQDTTLRFLREFNEEYGAHALPFLETGYGRAFELAKRELKFLLVVPLAPEHDQTGPFVRNVLLSEPVANYLNDPDKQTYLWGGTIQDSEPYQVAESLAITQFPAAALIALKPSVSSTAMSVITRLTGPETTSSPAEFVARLEAAATQHASELQRARATRDERNAARDLREQQNTAYERSLARDRERARQKREEEAARARELQRQKEEAETAERHANDLDNWRRWRATQLPPEPAPDQEAVRISFRLMDGERVTRKFPPSADIEDVYAFVECCPVVADVPNGTSGSSQPPVSAGYKHSYGFRLVSPMPREVYDLESGGSVRERIGRSGNLIVERIEEDEEGDEDQ